MNLYNSFLAKLNKQSAAKLILGCLLLEIASSFIFSNLFPNGGSIGFKFDSLAEEIVAVVLIAPVLETFFIQYLIITETLKYSKDNTLLALFISSSIFGLSHYYSIPYVVNTFFAGLTFGTLFLSQTPNFKRGFIYVLITHASYNIFALIMNNI